MLKFLIAFISALAVAQCYYAPPTLFGNSIRDLYGSNTVDFNLMAAAWKVRGLSKGSSKVGSCDGLILGGAGVVEQVGSFKRKYTDDLPTHDYLVFDIGVKFIGEWKDGEDAITLIIDGNGIKEFYMKTVGTSDAVATGCSGSGKDVYARLVGKVPHVAKQVTIQIEWAIFSSDSPSFGIYDVSLTAHDGASGDAPSAYLTLVDSDISAYGYGNYSDTAKTSCKSGYYLSGTSCMKCHPSCQECSSSSSSQCYQCADGYSYVEGKCVKCTGNCDECSGTGAKNCLLCSSGYTLDFDNSCTAKSSCKSSPYVIKKNTGSDISICTSVCSDNQYMYWNFTCGDCESGLTQETISGVKTCTYPCSADEYLYEDGSCQTTCSDTARSEDGYKFCLTADPCESGYLYEDGTCDSDCPSPYVWELGGAKNDTMYCKEPCPTGAFYTGESHGSPVCTDTCDVENIRFDNDIMYCSTNSTCPSIFHFLYPNKTCMSSCPEPYVGDYDNDGRLCNFPCADGQYVRMGLGTCLDTCDTTTNKIVEVNGILTCQLIPTADPIVTTKPNSAKKYATLGMMMRYNIGLDNFKSSVGISKFKTLIAGLLGVTSDEIRINKMYEGSTIIEAEVIVYTDDGNSQTVKFTNLKVNNMKEILQAAADAGQLSLDGVNVLNYQVTSATVEDDGSSSGSDVNKLAIGLGVGLTFLGVAVIGFLGYRFHMKSKLKSKSGSAYKTDDFEEDNDFVKKNPMSPKTPKTAKTPSDFSPVPRIDPEASHENLADQTEMRPIKDISKLPRNDFEKNSFLE